MANKYIVTGQGRLWVAPRDTSGVSGAMVELGDVDNFQVAFTQAFTEVYESQTGLRTNVVHAVHQTDGTVTVDALSIDPANLARAFYATAAVNAGGTVTGEAHTAYNGGALWINPGSTNVVVHNTASTPALLVSGTDYTYEQTNGRITILPGSTLVVAGAGVPVTVNYTDPGYAGKVEGLVNTLKDYKLVFEQINFDGSISRYELHRVALDLAKTFSMIMTGQNKLSMTGKLLPAAEITTAGLSKFFTVIQK